MREIYKRMKNTSVALGPHFDNFIQVSIEEGRYGSASEMVRAGLRLLEEEELRVNALRRAIDDGLNSGIATNFDPVAHLARLKTGLPDE